MRRFRAARIFACFSSATAQPHRGRLCSSIVPGTRAVCLSVCCKPTATSHQTNARVCRRSEAARCGAVRCGDPVRRYITSRPLYTKQRLFHQHAAWRAQVGRAAAVVVIRRRCAGGAAMTGGVNPYAHRYATRILFLVSGACRRWIFSNKIQKKKPFIYFCFYLPKPLHSDGRRNQI